MGRRGVLVWLLSLLVLVSATPAMAGADVTRYLTEYADGQWGFYSPNSTGLTAGVWSTLVVENGDADQTSTAERSGNVAVSWSGQLPDGTPVHRLYRAQFPDSQCSIDTKLGTARIWGTRPATVFQWVDGSLDHTVYESTLTLDLTMTATEPTMISGFGGPLEAEFPTNIASAARKTWGLVFSGYVVSGDGLSLTPIADDGSADSSSGEMSLFRYQEVVLPSK